MAKTREQVMTTQILHWFGRMMKSMDLFNIRYTAVDSGYNIVRLS